MDSYVDKSTEPFSEASAFALFADRDALSRNSKEARDIRYYMGHLGYEVGARKKVDGKVVAGFAKLQ